MAKNNELKGTDMKNHAYCYFDHMININDFNSKNIKIDKKYDI